MEKGKLWKMFYTMFNLSMFTFGGGYVIISLMKSKFVEELEWLSEEEVLNFAAIAQSCPGPVAVNAAILVGYRIGGIKGALVAILGTVLPPLIILSGISFVYVAFRDNIIVNAVLKGMQAGVAAVIFDVVFDLSATIFKKKDVSYIIVMFLAFVVTQFLGVNVMFIIISCACFGIVKSWYSLKKGGNVS
ncbi:chromate transporter [Tannockella kyphosi]|uniref:chromate transporter n=1 Tax=Tannockella kyphosi TaxID=2899121 RepID=UPI002011A811|nr:chromate transporter [Tannockella kyphosi]